MRQPWRNNRWPRRERDQRRDRWLASLMVGLLAVGASGPARATNQRAAFLGNEAALTAGALMASTREADAAWYNPAGLGGLEGNRLDLSASVFVLRLQGVDHAIDLQLPSGSYPQTLSANEILLVPAALVFGRRLSDSVSAGFGVYVLSSNDARYSNDFEVQGEEVPLVGPVDYAQGIEAQGLSTLYYLGPSLGWQVVPSLRLGLAVHGIYYRQLLSYKVYAKGQASTEDLSTFYSASESADLRALGLAASGGLQWAPGRGFHVGLLVRSPSYAVYHWTRGSLVATTSPVTSAPTLTNETIDTSAGGFDAFLPLSVQVGLAHTGPRHRIGLVLELLPPLSTENESISVETALAWNARLGGTFRISERIALGAGLYTDRSTVKELTSFGQTRLDYYGATFGLCHERRFAVGRRGLRFTTTVALGYALGVGDVGGLDLEPLNLLAPSTLRERDALFHEVGLHLGSGLSF